MSFMLLTERVKDGANFSVCDENTGVCAVSIILRDAGIGTTKYEVRDKHSKCFDLLISACGNLSARLEKMGELNIIFLKDSNKEKEIPIYFWDSGLVLKPPIKYGELACEQGGNYLFITPSPNKTESKNMLYATPTKAVQINDFAIINHNGEKKDCLSLMEKYNLTNVNIANSGSDVKIYSTNKDNETLVFDLGYKLLSRKEAQNEKV